MLINIVCIESSRPDWARQAFESYQSKFNKSININWNGCKPIQRNKNYDIERAIKDESDLLLSTSIIELPPTEVIHPVKTYLVSLKGGLPL